MSGDDRKGLLDGLDDDDWGNALDDWEKNSFTPSIAPAVESTAANPAPVPPPPPAPAAPATEAELPTETQETPIPAGFGPEPASPCGRPPSLWTEGHRGGQIR